MFECFKVKYDKCISSLLGKREVSYQKGYKCKKPRSKEVQGCYLFDSTEMFTLFSLSSRQTYS